MASVSLFNVFCFIIRLAHPPHLIQRIMDCVLCLMQRKLSTVSGDPDKPGLLKPSWSESQKLMAEAGFLGKLENFNKDTITEEVRVQLFC